MWTPILLSLLSLAHAEAPTVNINITGPAGDVTTLTGALPLESSEVLDMGSTSHRLDVRAEMSGEDIRVTGELHELRGKKDKVVRVASVILPAPGSSRSDRISWGAHKSATVPAELNPDLLAWRIEAKWSQPEAVPAEPAEETEPVEPAEPEAPTEPAGE
ncbi:MAG: hypothetical protein ACI8RZ_005826 [Myxococcota bacterium]|jgi:hypothetical protein